MSSLQNYNIFVKENNFMMKMIIPIYLADVIFAKFETRGRSKKKIDTILVKDMLVKGFTINDCITRKKNRLISQSGIKGECEIENIILKSQHSWGVND